MLFAKTGVCQQLEHEPKRGADTLDGVSSVTVKPKAESLQGLKKYGYWDVWKMYRMEYRIKSSIDVHSLGKF